MVTLGTLLEFARENRGVLMAEWQNSRPRKLSRIVFPTKLTRRNRQGVKSEFIKKVIDKFYPDVEDKGLEHSIYVTLADSEQQVLLCESNLDAKDGAFNHLAFEFPTYNLIRKREQEFKGLSGVLVQVVPETVD